jgi:hypothetical protein
MMSSSVENFESAPTHSRSRSRASADRIAANNGNQPTFCSSANRDAPSPSHVPEARGELSQTFFAESENSIEEISGPGSDDGPDLLTVEREKPPEIAHVPEPWKSTEISLG